MIFDVNPSPELQKFFELMTADKFPAVMGGELERLSTLLSRIGGVKIGRLETAAERLERVVRDGLGGEFAKQLRTALASYADGPKLFKRMSSGAIEMSMALLFVLVLVLNLKISLILELIQMLQELLWALVCPPMTAQVMARISVRRWVIWVYRQRFSKQLATVVSQMTGQLNSQLLINFGTQGILALDGKLSHHEKTFTESAGKAGAVSGGFGSVLEQATGKLIKWAPGMGPLAHKYLLQGLSGGLNEGLTGLALEGQFKPAALSAGGIETVIHTGAHDVNHNLLYHGAPGSAHTGNPLADIARFQEHLDRLNASQQAGGVPGPEGLPAPVGTGGQTGLIEGPTGEAPPLRLEPAPERALPAPDFASITPAPPTGDAAAIAEIGDQAGQPAPALSADDAASVVSDDSTAFDAATASFVDDDASTVVSELGWGPGADNLSTLDMPNPALVAQGVLEQQGGLVVQSWDDLASVPDGARVVLVLAPAGATPEEVSAGLANVLSRLAVDGVVLVPNGPVVADKKGVSAPGGWDRIRRNSSRRSYATTDVRDLAEAVNSAPGIWRAARRDEVLPRLAGPNLTAVPVAPSTEDSPGPPPMLLPATRETPSRQTPAQTPAPQAPAPAPRSAVADGAAPAGATLPVPPADPSVRDLDRIRGVADLVDRIAEVSDLGEVTDQATATNLGEVARLVIGSSLFGMVPETTPEQLLDSLAEIQLRQGDHGAGLAELRERIERRGALVERVVNYLRGTLSSFVPYGADLRPAIAGLVPGKGAAGGVRYAVTGLLSTADRQWLEDHGAVVELPADPASGGVTITARFIPDPVGQGRQTLVDLEQLLARLLRSNPADNHYHADIQWLARQLQLVREQVVRLGVALAGPGGRPDPARVREEAAKLRPILAELRDRAARLYVEGSGYRVWMQEITDLVEMGLVYAGSAVREVSDPTPPRVALVDALRDSYVELDRIERLVKLATDYAAARTDAARRALLEESGSVAVWLPRNADGLLGQLDRIESAGRTRLGRVAGPVDPSLVTAFQESVAELRAVIRAGGPALARLDLGLVEAGVWSAPHLVAEGVAKLDALGSRIESELESLPAPRPHPAGDTEVWNLRKLAAGRRGVRTAAQRLAAALARHAGTPPSAPAQGGAVRGVRDAATELERQLNELAAHAARSGLGLDGLVEEVLTLGRRYVAGALRSVSDVSTLTEARAGLASVDALMRLVDQVNSATSDAERDALFAAAGLLGDGPLLGMDIEDLRLELDVLESVTLGRMSQAAAAEDWDQWGDLDEFRQNVARARERIDAGAAVLSRVLFRLRQPVPVPPEALAVLDRSGPGVPGRADLVFEVGAGVPVDREALEWRGPVVEVSGAPEIVALPVPHVLAELTRELNRLGARLDELRTPASGYDLVLAGERQRAVVGATMKLAAALTGPGRVDPARVRAAAAALGQQLEQLDAVAAGLSALHGDSATGSVAAVLRLGRAYVAAGHRSASDATDTDGSGMSRSMSDPAEPDAITGSSRVAARGLADAYQRLRQLDAQADLALRPGRPLDRPGQIQLLLALQSLEEAVADHLNGTGTVHADARARFRDAANTVIAKLLAPLATVDRATATVVFESVPGDQDAFRSLVEQRAKDLAKGRPDTDVLVAQHGRRLLDVAAGVRLEAFRYGQVLPEVLRLLGLRPGVIKPVDCAAHGHPLPESVLHDIARGAVLPVRGLPFSMANLMRPLPGQLGAVQGYLLPITFSADGKQWSPVPAAQRRYRLYLPDGSVRDEDDAVRSLIMADLGEVANPDYFWAWPSQGEDSGRRPVGVNRNPMGPLPDQRPGGPSAAPGTGPPRGTAFTVGFQGAVESLGRHWHSSGYRKARAAFMAELVRQLENGSPHAERLLELARPVLQHAARHADGISDIRRTVEELRSAAASGSQELETANEMIDKITTIEAVPGMLRRLLRDVQAWQSHRAVVQLAAEVGDAQNDPTRSAERKLTSPSEMILDSPLLGELLGTTADQLDRRGGHISESLRSILTSPELAAFSWPRKYDLAKHSRLLEGIALLRVGEHLHTSLHNLTLHIPRARDERTEFYRKLAGSSAGNHSFAPEYSFAAGDTVTITWVKRDKPLPRTSSAEVRPTVTAGWVDNLDDVIALAHEGMKPELRSWWDLGNVLRDGQGALRWLTRPSAVPRFDESFREFADLGTEDALGHLASATAELSVEVGFLHDAASRIGDAINMLSADIAPRPSVTELTATLWRIWAQLNAILPDRAKRLKLGTDLLDLSNDHNFSAGKLNELKDIAKDLHLDAPRLHIVLSQLLVVRVTAPAPARINMLAADPDAGPSDAPPAYGSTGDQTVAATTGGVATRGLGSPIWFADMQVVFGDPSASVGSVLGSVNRMADALRNDVGAVREEFRDELRKQLEGDLPDGTKLLDIATRLIRHTALHHDLLDALRGHLSSGITDEARQTSRALNHYAMLGPLALRVASLVQSWKELRSISELAEAVALLSGQKRHKTDYSQHIATAVQGHPLHLRLLGLTPDRLAGVRREVRGDLYGLLSSQEFRDAFNIPHPRTGEYSLASLADSRLRRVPKKKYGQLFAELPRVPLTTPQNPASGSAGRVLTTWSADSSPVVKTDIGERELTDLVASLTAAVKSVERSGHESRSLTKRFLGQTDKRRFLEWWNFGAPVRAMLPLVEEIRGPETAKRSLTDAVRRFVHVGGFPELRHLGAEVEKMALDVVYLDEAIERLRRARAELAKYPDLPGEFWDLRAKLDQLATILSASAEERKSYLLISSVILRDGEAAAHRGVAPRPQDYYSTIRTREQVDFGVDDTWVANRMTMMASTANGVRGRFDRIENSGQVSPDGKVIWFSNDDAVSEFVGRLNVESDFPDGAPDDMVVVVEVIGGGILLNGAPVSPEEFGQVFQRKAYDFGVRVRRVRLVVLSRENPADQGAWNHRVVHAMGYPVQVTMVPFSDVELGNRAILVDQQAAEEETAPSSSDGSENSVRPDWLDEAIGELSAGVDQLLQLVGPSLGSAELGRPLTKIKDAIRTLAEQQETVNSSSPGAEPARVAVRESLVALDVLAGEVAVLSGLAVRRAAGANPHDQVVLLLKALVMEGNAVVKELQTRALVTLLDGGVAQFDEVWNKEQRSGEIAEWWQGQPLDRLRDLLQTSDFTSVGSSDVVTSVAAYFVASRNRKEGWLSALDDMVPALSETRESWRDLRTELADVLGRLRDWNARQVVPTALRPAFDRLVDDITQIYEQVELVCAETFANGRFVSSLVGAARSMLDREGETLSDFVTRAGQRETEIRYRWSPAAEALEGDLTADEMRFLQENSTIVDNNGEVPGGFHVLFKATAKQEEAFNRIVEHRLTEATDGKPAKSVLAMGLGAKGLLLVPDGDGVREFTYRKVKQFLEAQQGFPKDLKIELVSCFVDGLSHPRPLLQRAARGGAGLTAPTRAISVV
ncbi:MAG TPA: hypothetical protein VGR06_35155, partial [Actinophytocola sp.]|nr:hypothetical protein [Actinophytocola sp.]